MITDFALTLTESQQLGSSVAGFPQMLPIAGGVGAIGTPLSLDLRTKTDLARGTVGWSLMFEVIEAFTVGSGTPLLSMRAVLADDAIIGTRAMSVGAAMGTLGVFAAIGLDLNAPVFNAAGLSLGATFYAPIGPLSRDATSDQFQETVNGQLYGRYMKRYLSCYWNFPNFASAAFAAGKMRVRLAPNNTIPEQHGLQGIYPSAFKVL